MLTTETQTLQLVDVGLGGNRTVRIKLERSMGGAPTDLSMEMGWGEGIEWRPDGPRLSLPGASIGLVKEALEALSTGNGER